jgi:hypothetical protein
VSLVARHLEANGIPTVINGTARDIVEACGVARFVFTDFPLGNPCGEPFDIEMQRHIVGMCLDLLETATGPGATVQSPYTWSEGESWKENVLTKEHPFLEGEAYDRWMEGKEQYRKAKKAGEV